MPPKPLIRTRRIQLLIDVPDAAERKAHYNTLHHWRHICFRAANLIFTHHFLQEGVKELFYFTDRVNVKLKDLRLDEDGILTTSKMNTTYQLLSQRFKGSMPMSILTCLNKQLVGVFGREKEDYYGGLRSLRNYRRDIVLPFKAEDVRGLHAEGKSFCFSFFSIPVCTYLGRDFTDKRRLLEGVVEGKVKLCSSGLKLEGKKIYWLANFQVDREEVPLDAGVIAEVRLSVECPLAVRIGDYRCTIGNKEEYLYRRLAIQAGRQRAQQAAAFNRKDKGRRRQEKNLERFRHAERNYIHTKLHVYSRRLIEVCMKQGAGTILLCNGEEAQALAKEDGFLIRNWSYGALAQMIRYKAERVGMEVIME